MTIITLDLFAVALVVCAALFFLLSRFRSPTPPACHQTGAPLVDAGPTVVLGASLQKGLRRAQERERARSTAKRVRA